MNQEKCTWAQEQLAAYLYDDLSPAERTAFEEHLAGCLKCQEELRASRTVLTFIDQADLTAAPAGVPESVIANVLAQVTADRRAIPFQKVGIPHRRRFRILAAMAASLLAVVLGLWAYLGGEKRQMDPELDLLIQAVAADAESVVQLTRELRQENQDLMTSLKPLTPTPLPLGERGRGEGAARKEPES